MMKERAAAGVPFTFVIGESALVRPVRGPRLMADQLRMVNEVGELPNVSVRVIPAGVHVRPELAARAFEILDLPEAAGLVFGHRPPAGWQVEEANRSAAYVAAFERLADRRWTMFPLAS